jgi:hypothetical protein
MIIKEAQKRGRQQVTQLLHDNKKDQPVEATPLIPKSSAMITAAFSPIASAVL